MKILVIAHPFDNETLGCRLEQFLGKPRYTILCIDITTSLRA